MSAFKTFVSLLKTPGIMIEPLGRRKLLNWMSDEMYLKLLYKGRMGKKLNLKNPKTFNVKIHDHNPEYIEWVDKIKAKENIVNIFGQEYVVPTLAIWEKAEDIDFSSIPSKCVLKCNHDQGSTIIYERGCDCEKIRRHFQERLKRNPYVATREWPYKSVASKIMCEPFLAENIVDYKFFCFEGKVGMINVGMKDPAKHITYVTFLDKAWNYMPFQRNDFSPVETLPEKPESLDKMISMAEKLAANRHFVRIDFYSIDQHIYFSEFTLYPTSGLIRFQPEDGDEILGELIKLQ